MDSDRRYETIAALGHRLDILGAVGVIAECGSNLPYRKVQPLFKIDERAGSPHLLSDFLASDDLSRPAYQKNQYPSRLRCQVYRLAIFAQFSASEH